MRKLLKHIKLTIIMVLVFLLTMFCTKKKNTTVYSNIIEKQVKLVTKTKILIDESLYSIGELHWNGFVDQQRNLYIMDRKNMTFLKYSPNGKLLFIIGQKGKGPGEYKKPHLIFVDSTGHIYIFDISKFSTIVYDSTGSFITEIKYARGIPYPGTFYIDKNVKIVSFLEYEGSNPFGTVKFFHFIDNNFSVYKTVSITYPSIYRKYNLLNYQAIYWCFARNHFYVLFAAVPFLYKFNMQGTLVQHPKNFRIINQNVSRLTLPGKIKQFSKFSVNNQLFLFKKKYLLQIYSNTKLPESNLPPSPFELNKYRKFFYQIHTTDGESLNLKNNAIPGKPLYCSPVGELYVLTQNIPLDREITVYEIEIQ